MQLAILGGTGRIGAQLVSQALDAGQQVRVLARNPDALAPVSGLTVIAGDVLDQAQVAGVVDGADAVLCALGPRGAKAPALMAGAGRTVVEAMTKTGAKRLISVSAAGAYVAHDPDMGAVVKFVLPGVFGAQFADLREMERVVADSDLDWTIVRPVRLTNGPLTGHYRVRPQYAPAGGRKISRADVAHFMGQVLAEGAWPRSAPALAY
jgi:putative NADH-flavin reductase